MKKVGVVVSVLLGAVLLAIVVQTRVPRYELGFQEGSRLTGALVIDRFSGWVCRISWRDNSMNDCVQFGEPAQ